MTKKKTTRKPTQLLLLTTSQRILLLAVLFLSLVAIPLSLYLVQQRQEIRKEAAPTAVLSLLPATQTVNLGEIFNVQVYLKAGGNPIRGGDVSLSFDPGYLEVTDADSNTKGIQVTPGTIFPDPWVAVNQADNATGKIFLSINTFSSFAGEEGVFGTVQFKTKTLTPSTEVSFNPEETKITAVGGESVAAAKNSASFKIVPVSTVTPTPIVSPIPTPTYYCESDSDCFLTPTPIGSPTPTSPPIYYCENNNDCGCGRAKQWSFCMIARKDSLVSGSENTTCADFCEGSNVACVDNVCRDLNEERKVRCTTDSDCACGKTKDGGSCGVGRKEFIVKPEPWESCYQGCYNPDGTPKPVGCGEDNLCRYLGEKSPPS